MRARDSPDARQKHGSVRQRAWRLGGWTKKSVSQKEADAARVEQEGGIGKWDNSNKKGQSRERENGARRRRRGEGRRKKEEEGEGEEEEEGEEGEGEEDRASECNWLEPASYLASQAVSQLGRYQREYKFNSFYFTAHLVLPHPGQTLFHSSSYSSSPPFHRALLALPGLTALICFKYARRKFRLPWVQVSMATAIDTSNGVCRLVVAAVEIGKGEKGRSPGVLFLKRLAALRRYEN